MTDMKISPEEIKEKLEPVGDAVAKAGKTVAKKAEPAVKAVGEKAREVGRAAGEKAKTVGSLAGEKAKQAGREAASTVTPLIYIQYGEKEYECDELVERAKADFREKNKGGIRSCKLYIKPEENAAYYVISGKEGKIEL